MVETSNIEREFLEAYEQYADGVFRLCYFRVYNRERAKELTQETFLRTWRYLAEERGTIDNLKAFLYRTARNLVIDESRRKQTQSLDVMQEYGFDPPAVRDNPRDGIDARLALQAVSRLEEPYRTALTLRYVEGLNPREIAEITDSTENAVSVRIHRGIKLLRALLV